MARKILGSAFTAAMARSFSEMGKKSPKWPEKNWAALPLRRWPEMSQKMRKSHKRS